MELLESQDPEKKKLIETSDRHKRALEKEVNELTEKTERVLTNALIIGGSLALTYFVISSLWGGKKKKRKKKNRGAKAITEEGTDSIEEITEEIENPAVIGQIGTKVLNHATVFLLDLAKEKLFEFLESRKKGNENS